MTEYGYMLNGQLIKHSRYHDGDKPLIYTDELSADGYKAVFYWKERPEDIIQVWELVEDDSDTEEMIPTADDKAEAYDILMGVSK